MCSPKSLKADTQVCPYIFSPLLSKERVRVTFKKKKTQKGRICHAIGRSPAFCGGKIRPHKTKTPDIKNIALGSGTQGYPCAAKKLE